MFPQTFYYIRIKRLQQVVVRVRALDEEDAVIRVTEGQGRVIDETTLDWKDDFELLETENEPYETR